MARRRRIQYPGAIYHIVARGNDRQDIVADDADRGRLEACLECAVKRSGWELSRVEVWRGGLGRCLCSLLARPFVCGCHIISTMLRFHTPLIKPDSRNRKLIWSHLAGYVQPCLSSSCRPCTAWWSGSRSARRTFSKEGCHGMRGQADLEYSY